MTDHHCTWCGKARGILPTGVLICPRCDCVAEGDHGFPNEHLVKDVKL